MTLPKSMRYQSEALPSRWPGTFLHLELDFFREGLDLGAGRTGREHEVLGDEGEVRDLQDFDFLGFLRVQDFGDLFGFF